MISHYLTVEKTKRFLYNTHMNMNEQEKRKTWVIGVSGGADSMALLNMCHSANMHVIVAHMNYQKRASANRDMEGVRAFCQCHNIPIEIRFQEEECQENFQAFARKQRYAFYHDIIVKYKASGVLVAHQMDDHIETYLMQKQRDSIPSCYGISRYIKIYGCQVVRPLLSYTKAQLEQYCDEHKVPYYHDESNFSDDYTRNRIRHEYIDHMDAHEKAQYCERIIQENEHLKVKEMKNIQILQDWQNKCEVVKSLDFDEFESFIQYWIFTMCKIHISKKECNTIYDLLQSNANKWTRRMDNAYDIYKYDEKLSIIEHDIDSYMYTYDAIRYEETPYFRLEKQGSSTEAVTLHENDFPITIRNVKKGDEITMRFGTKKLNRWFIDRKIPVMERKTWPVIVNASNKIILVPKLGCDISHFSNNPNLFVIK